jgi:cation transport ATPase
MIIMEPETIMAGVETDREVSRRYTKMDTDPLNDQQQDLLYWAGIAESNSEHPLAQADIGIAMGAAGTDLAIETADIALMSDDLMKIPDALHISKLTLKNIRQNVVFALVTVTALLAGVFMGSVHMAGGMLIHELSVMAVILNGFRLRYI